MFRVCRLWWDLAHVWARTTGPGICHGSLHFLVSLLINSGGLVVCSILTLFAE